MSEATTFCNKATLCRMLGVNAQTISRYVEAGMPKQGIGRATTYNIPDCVKWLVAHSVDEAQKSFTDKLKDGDDSSWMTRRVRAEALMKELELEKERGILVNVVDAEKELSHHLSAIRGALLGFPSRTAPYVVGMENEIQAREALEAQVRTMMDGINESVTVQEMADAEDELHHYEDKAEAEDEEEREEVIDEPLEDPE